MSYLKGKVHRDLAPEDQPPCVLCKVRTDTFFEPQGRPEVGPLPLHSGCAAYLVALYPDWVAASRELTLP